MWKSGLKCYTTIKLYTLCVTRKVLPSVAAVILLPNHTVPFSALLKQVRLDEQQNLAEVYCPATSQLFFSLQTHNFRRPYDRTHPSWGHKAYQHPVYNGFEILHGSKLSFCPNPDSPDLKDGYKVRNIPSNTLLWIGQTQSQVPTPRGWSHA